MTAATIDEKVRAPSQIPPFLTGGMGGKPPANRPTDLTPNEPENPDDSKFLNPQTFIDSLGTAPDEPTYKQRMQQQKPIDPGYTI